MLGRVDSRAEDVLCPAGRQRLVEAPDQLVHGALADTYQARHAEQGDEGREQGQEPVIGQAARGHAAPVAGELLAGALERVLPAGPAEFERRLRAAGHLVLRGDRLRVLLNAGLPAGTVPVLS